MAMYLGRQKVNSILSEYATTTMNTDDATATASHILKGFTAYIKGKKVTGALATSSIFVATTEAEPDASIGVDGDLYLVVIPE